jgi:hypothetical protein
MVDKGAMQEATITGEEAETLARRSPHSRASARDRGADTEVCQLTVLARSIAARRQPFVARSQHRWDRVGRVPDGHQREIRRPGATQEVGLTGRRRGNLARGKVVTALAGRRPASRCRYQVCRLTTSAPFDRIAAGIAVFSAARRVRLAESPTDDGLMGPQRPLAADATGNGRVKATSSPGAIRAGLGAPRAPRS